MTHTKYDPHQHRGGFPFDLRAPILVYTAEALWHAGYPTQALQRGYDALVVTRDESQPMIAAYALTFSAMVHEFCGRTGTVHTQSESVVAFSTEQGLPYWLAFAEMLHGAALVAQGQISEGKSQINQGLANYRATGATLGSSYFLALLADAYRTAGQVEEGLAVLAEALSVVDKSGERFYEAELYRLKGELLLMQAEKLKG